VIQRPRHAEIGFTLLEVLVTLSILGVGTAITLSLVSGSLRNIRKVQTRTKYIQYAETVMELSLLDESIDGPTVLQGDFEDGTRWNVAVTDFAMPEKPSPPDMQQVIRPQVKVLSYSVEILGANSASPDFKLDTLKLIGIKVQEGGPATP